MKKTTTRTTIIIVLLVVAVVGYYAYLSSRSRKINAEESMSVVETTLSRDLAKDYPPTPKEVVKYYNEILKCFYNEESTEGEIEALGLKARELYDEELLENNELGTYLIRLSADVKDYRDNNRRITGINLASSANVDIFEKNGFTFAKIRCGYNITQAGKTYPSNQMYLLRKDPQKRWKIYGWKNVNELEESAQ